MQKDILKDVKFAQKTQKLVKDAKVNVKDAETIKRCRNSQTQRLNRCRKFCVKNLNIK